MRKFTAIMTLFVFFLFYSLEAISCTGITLEAKDGAVVFGRTLEFAKNLKSEVIVVPRNMKFTGMTADGRNGLEWKTKFAAVGANFENTQEIIDGINEKGLSSGIFYFPGYTEYQPATKSDYDKTLAPWQLVTWILTNFESVDEVREQLYHIKVANVVYDKWKMVLPFHYIVTDSKGNSIVIEYVKGKMNIYDNLYGVITNTPPFDWMLTNIQNYLYLSANNLPERELAGKKLSPFGQGSGMLGIPGDFTPPSRFIRALFFASASLIKDNSQETAMQAFHILNNFDIPDGVVRSEQGDVTEYDITQWTSVHDLHKKNFYFKTAGNSRIRVVKLMDCNLNSKDIKKIKMDTPEDIKDVTEGK